ncbi:energy transducer TonB [Hippea maritima]|uniref:TonB family protein n=1 Tax=Hippea maritima (strain ATCC 700847 / DSM 10411 / MH2) TaxID=760142 RepID=F2LWA0_HIPMA|nr:energy transducer TonB [Hippea maritima]AEA34034.1 TonB family protein [Hippea maritima DSM 10411]
MKRFKRFVIISIIFSLFLHSILFFLVFQFLKPKKLPTPPLPKQVFVDIIRLPKPKIKVQKKKQEEHKIAANIQREGRARVYSKEEKIPYGEAKPRLEKVKPHPESSKQKVKTKPKIAKNKTSKSKAVGLSRPKKSNLVKLKGGLFNEKLLSDLSKRGFSSGTSNQYKYKNAKKEATISIGTQELKYASYMAKLKNKIQDVWVYPQQAIQTGQQGALLILFSIGKDGRLVRLKLIRSSGYPILDNAALQAIKDASPFAPLPKRFGIDVLNIYATFEYRLSNYFIY